MPKPSLAKKLQGSLIGFAIGDAMGATTEFCDKMQIQQLYGVVDHPRACGEHASNRSKIPAITGSSPRMRGAL